MQFDKKEKTIEKSRKKEGFYIILTNNDIVEMKNILHNKLIGGNLNEQI